MNICLGVKNEPHLLQIYQSMIITLGYNRARSTQSMGNHHKTVATIMVACHTFCPFSYYYYLLVMTKVILQT